jgi:hypothetical protein
MVGNFGSGIYWSSTEFGPPSDLEAWYNSFILGGQNGADKGFSGLVRCVRAIAY